MSLFPLGAWGFESLKSEECGVCDVAVMFLIDLWGRTFPGKA